VNRICHKALRIRARDELTHSTGKLLKRVKERISGDYWLKSERKSDLASSKDNIYASYKEVHIKKPRGDKLVES